MRLRLIFLSFMVVLGTVVNMIPVMPAEAAPCPGNCDYPPAARDYYRGYLTNAPDDGQNHGAVWPQDSGLLDVSNANQFITWMQGSLFNTSNGSVNDRAGAAAYVVTAMLGYKGPDFGGNFLNGVNTARARWNDWRNLVLLYEANGWANFSVMNSDCFPYVQANMDYDTHDVFFFNNNFGPTGQCTLTEEIVFSNPGGGTFRLKKICGNPVGTQSPLTQPALTASLQSIGSDVIGTSVQAGGTYSLHAVLSNPSAVASTPPTFLEVAVTRGAAAVPPGTVFPLTNGTAGADAPHTDATVGYSTSSTLQATGQTGASRFFWHYIDAVPAGGNRMPPDGFSFTIPASTPTGTQVCFTAYASPVAPAGYGGGPAVPAAVRCFTVQAPGYPAVVGQGGDVQAGGGLCGGTLTDGTIQGQANAGSYGDYVVSASGSITNFASAGGAGGLTLGQNGGYDRVCRPDLYTAANSYRLATPSASDSTATDLDLGSIGADGVYYFHGPSLSVHGVVRHNITIVYYGGGNVNVTGNITLDTSSHARDQTPVLGVISRTNININAAATTVDAFLFANGTIDTCVEANVSCNNVLTVHGFLMGNRLLLHRRGNSGASGATPGENITLGTQLYLNPPMFFDQSVDTTATLLQGQGEKQPLF